MGPGPVLFRRGLGAGAGGLLLSGCSPASVLNVLAPDRLAAEGVRFGLEVRQRLDIYRPTGSGPFPVMMFLYGGAWDSGDRAMYRFVGDAFAAHGILTVIPDYRLWPQVRYPVFLQDCALALAWTRANIAGYGGLPSAPALIGHSAGAYNSAMLALDPSLLGAVGLSPSRDLSRVVGLAGPYDFLPLHSDELRAVFGPGPAGPSTQPISHVDGRNPPMLLAAGTADGTVMPANTIRLAARIRADAGPVEERLYPGVDHLGIVGAIARPLRSLAPTLHDCLAFLRS